MHCTDPTQHLNRRLSTRIMSDVIARHDLHALFRKGHCANRSVQKRSPPHGRSRSAADACRRIQFRPSRLGSCDARNAIVCATAAEAQSVVKFDTMLLPLIDANPYLSDGSKQAVAAAVALGRANNSKIIVLVLNPSAGGSPEDSQKRTETLTWHFQQSDFSNFEIAESGTDNASVTLGDFADQSAADMVIMSSEAVHVKSVDANLLAEFVPCPMLLLP